MTLEEKIKKAVELLAAAMNKEGLRGASGFVPTAPTQSAESGLDELLASRASDAMDAQRKRNAA